MDTGADQREAQSMSEQDDRYINIVAHPTGHGWYRWPWQQRKPNHKNCPQCMAILEGRTQVYG